MSRATKAYASAYQLDRVHASRVFKYAKRTYSVDFTAALEPGETIQSATWRVLESSTIVMSDPTLTKANRQANVICQAGLDGWAIMKCEATTTDGRVLNQLFKVSVMDSPWFDGEFQPNAGPYTVTVNAS